MFLALEDLMKAAFPDAFQTPRPEFVIELPEPEPEPEKTWWQKLFAR